MDLDPKEAGALKVSRREGGREGGRGMFVCCMCACDVCAMRVCEMCCMFCLCHTLARIYVY
jgi:hypothetical protein